MYGYICFASNCALKILAYAGAQIMPGAQIAYLSVNVNKYQLNNETFKISLYFDSFKSSAGSSLVVCRPEFGCMFNTSCT